MPTTQELRLQIEVDDNGSLKVKNFGEEILKVGENTGVAKGKLKLLEQSVGGAEGKFKQLKDTLSSVADKLFSLKTLAGAVIGAFSLYKLTQVTKNWMDLAGAQENAEKSLRQVMVSMNRYSSDFYDSLTQQAAALQKLTGVGDEAIIQGQKFLMTFKQIPDELMPRVSRSMLDLAALMGGGAAGVQRAALTMGKAAMGLTGELRRVGITVDVDTYKLKGFAGVLQEIEAQVKGQAEVLGQGFGLWTRYASAVGDTKEQLGYFFNAIFTHTGLLEGLIKNTEAMNEKLEAFKKSGRLDEWALSVAETAVAAAENIITAFEQVLLYIENNLLPGFGKIEDRINDIKSASGWNTAQTVGGWLKTSWDFLTRGTVADALKHSFVGDTGRSGYLAYQNMLGNKQKNESSLNAWLRGLGKIKKGLQNLREGLHSYKAESSQVMGGDSPASSGIMGYKTYFDYYRQIQLERTNQINAGLREQGDIITSIHPKMDTIITDGLKWFDQVEAQQKAWERLSQTIGDSFTDALVDSLENGLDSFKDFAKEIKHIFLKLWMDKAITQPIIMPIVNQASGLFGFGDIAGITGSKTEGFAKFIGSSAFGRKGGATYGQALGAGAIGYGMGGIGGGLGATAGMVMGGPIGAIIGGELGSMIQSAFEHAPEPKIPEFDLLWETIDGQIAEVTESWKNMGRDQKVVAAAEEFVQSQLDFFQKLTIVTGGGEVPSFDFRLGGLGRDIEDILKQQTGEGLVKTALGAAGRLSEFFGPGFREQLKDLFIQTMTSNLGMFTFGQNQQVFQDYIDWKFDQFMAMPSNEAMSSFESWMNKSPIFFPGDIFALFRSVNPNLDYANPTPNLFSQLEQFAASQRPWMWPRSQIALRPGEEQPWQNFFTDFNQQITDIFDLVTNGMGEAFSASLQTGEFQTFEDKFKQSILSSVQQGLIKGFAEQELLPIIFKPFYESGDRPAFTETLQQYQSGNLSLTQTQEYLSQILAEFNTTLAGFEPAWELLNQANQSLVDALGFNTNAIASNTDAIMGPVNSFLMSLDTGPLAPSQSLAGIMSTEEELYTAALADPSKFAAYASYMTQTGLPTAQGLGSNYADIVAGVRSDVMALPWVAQAQNAPTAQSIGYEVGQSLGPMLADLKESGQITINVVIDGQVIKQTVIDSLDDPAVAQKVRART